MLNVDDFKAIRKKHGLRQADLANTIGLDRTAVSKIEGLERALTLAEAAAWAQACGFQLALIDPTANEHIHLLDQLPPSRRSLAIRLLRLLSRLEMAHIVTLEAIVNGWEKVAFSQVDEADQAERIVKKM